MVRVRQLVRAVAVAAKLSLVDQTKLVTAASELARNTLVYGGGGSAEVERRRQRPPARASGSSSPTTAPASPTSTWPSPTATPPAAGSGLGLSGARRLVDEFDIETAVGRGHHGSRSIKWAR